jgi:hypothetical protein
MRADWLSASSQAAEMISAFEARSVICICLGARSVKPPALPGCRFAVWWVLPTRRPAVPSSYHQRWWLATVSTADPWLPQVPSVQRSSGAGTNQQAAPLQAHQGTPPCGPTPCRPLSNPAHLPYTQVRRPLGHLGAAGFCAVQRVPQPVQAGQGARLDPPMGGDDGCRTMRKPLRFSEQKVGRLEYTPFEFKLDRWSIDGREAIGEGVEPSGGPRSGRPGGGEGPLAVRPIPKPWEGSSLSDPFPIQKRTQKKARWPVD